MTSSVTAPLEVQFGQMPGLNQMSSIEFRRRLGDHAAVQPRPEPRHRRAGGAGGDQRRRQPAAFGPARAADLRQGQPGRRADPHPGITSKTLPLTQLEDLADTRMAQKISQVPGVGLVSVSGGQRPAVRVQANLRALAAYGLNIDDLRTTIANANVNAPKGTFDGPTRSYTINANDQIQSAEAYENVIVAYKNGAPVRLSDVAKVDPGRRERLTRRLGQQRPRRIILNIQRQPGANVIQVVDRIKKLLPELQSSLPAAARRRRSSPTAPTPSAPRCTTWSSSCCLAVILVVLVIFLFLRSLPATIIPSLSVPLSLIGTLAAMYLLGFSLNNLSLMALTIATGFVVDDAIVMIENISRYIEEGDDAARGGAEGLRADRLHHRVADRLADRGADPAAVHGRRGGRLFREFAITLAITIVISAVVSLTLVPMLCASCCATTRRPRRAASRAGRTRIVRALIDHYGRALSWVLDRQPMTLLVAVATLVLTILLYVFIPKGFFPVQDTGVIQGITEAPQSVSFAGDGATPGGAGRGDPQGPRRREPVLVHRRRRHEHHAQQRPHADQPEAASSDRNDSASAIIRRLQRQAATSPGITLYMQPVQDLTIDDHGEPHPVPVRAGGREPGGIQHLGAAAGRPSCSSCRSWRTWPATSRTRGWRPTSRSTATPPRASASRRPRSTTPSTTPSASASSRPSSPSRTSTGSSWRPTRRLTNSLEAAGHDLPAVGDRGRRSGAAVRARQGRPSRPRRCRSATSAQFPADHHLLQPRPRRVRSARRSTAIREAPSRARPAGEHDDHLPGRRAGLPGLARQRSCC